MTISLSRRHLLQWMGLSAGALCVPGVPTAHAETGLPRRIVFITTPHGTVMDNWQMNHLFPGDSSESDNHDWEVSLKSLRQEEMSPILREFHDLREKSLFLKGVSLASAISDTPGNDHSVGNFHALTGAPIFDEDENVAALPWRGMSVDQVIAERIAIPGRFRSLHLRNLGRTNGYEGDGTFCRALGGTRIPIQGNMYALWERLFGETEPSSPLATQLGNQRGSILDFVADQFQATGPRVSKADRVKMMQHKERLRDLELRMSALSSLECATPDKDGYGDHYQKLTHFQGVNQIMATLLGAAFSCDLSRVVHIDIGNGQSMGDFLGAPDHHIHNDLAHSDTRDDFAREKMTLFGQYNAKMVADLARTFDAIPEGSGSMLDHTVIVWTGDVGTGGHGFGPMPYVLIGGGDGMLNTGRYVHYGPHARLPDGKTIEGKSYIGAAHNQLLVGLCHAMGLTDIDWVGQSRILGQMDVNGPLRGLLPGDSL